jgi:hypothetical protein
MMQLLSPSEQKAWVQVYEKIFASITQHGHKCDANKKTQP